MGSMHKTMPHLVWDEHLEKHVGTRRHRQRTEETQSA